MSTSRPIISPKKLIEVALPLDAINAASAREKSIRHGHPSTLHLWWARRPLAAARAVIFAQLVHDPEDLWRCQNPGVEPNNQEKGHWTKARARLFTIIEDLVKWENTTNEAVLEPARAEIRKAWRESCELNRDHPRAKELFDPAKMPGLHDPFAGGGTIPLEAQRLGLEAHASDLNPVAVLINKAMIEIPPKFAGRPPVHPDCRDRDGEWKGAAGLAEDVRYYGKWMRDEAFKRIGHLYPPIEVTAEMAKDRPDLEQYVGKKLTVIAWLWARTVKSPNPAFSHIEVPLASSFLLSTKEGKAAYVEPELSEIGYKFNVVVGRPPESAKVGTSFGKQKGFRCLMSQTPINYGYIREEALGRRMRQKLMAVVAEGTRGRVYLAPTAEHEAVAATADPEWRPDLKIPEQALGFRVQLYGMTTFGDLFTPRQLVALTTLSQLVGEVKERVLRDAISVCMPNDNLGLDARGDGALAYAEAISIYAAFGMDKVANYASTICTWNSGLKYETVTSTFGRQAIPMTWDFAESNLLSDSSGNLLSGMNWIAGVLADFPVRPQGSAMQVEATCNDISNGKFVSTDPPYFDNIGYADLSDYFYVWVRHSLRAVFPTLLGTISVPKTEELVATPFRHGTKQKAQAFFLNGMTQAMRRLADRVHPARPAHIKLPRFTS